MAMATKSGDSGAMEASGGGRGGPLPVAVSGSGINTTTQSNPEAAAAEIIAGLAPAGGGGLELDTNGNKEGVSSAVTLAAAASAKMPRGGNYKKRKHEGTKAGVQPHSRPFRGMDDGDLVQAVALEFKKRGYTLAIKLGLDEDALQKHKKDAPEKEGSGEGEEALSKKPKADHLPSQLQPLPSFAFYPSSVSHSQRNVDAWNATFEQVRAYAANHNGSLPLHLSAEATDDEARLVKWTKAQLILWKRMRKDAKHNLSLDRIRKLHSVGFDAVAGKAGDLPVDADGTVPKMGEEQLQQKLAEPKGFNAQKWVDRFEQLKKYKALHGDTNVPRSYDDALSKWCATQRLRAREVNGEQGFAGSAMTPTQYQALESVGFEMSTKRKRYDRTVIDKKWEARFDELVQFKEKHGTCDVAVRKGLEDYKQLANWAGLQRRKWKAKQAGKQSGRSTGITDEQIKKLASVGFSFSLQDDFETRFKHLLEFKKEHGHTKVPVFYTGYNNLGRWAKRMRDGIRNNEPWMDEVRRTRLLGIDFDTAARHVFGHKQKKGAASAQEDHTVEEAALDAGADAPGLMAAANTMARLDGALPSFGNAVGAPGQQWTFANYQG